MPEITVRPSTKLLKAAYLLAALLAAAILILARGERQGLLYLLAIPGLLAAWAALRHFGLAFTRLTVAGDSLRFESGVLSKTTRSMELRKVQDVLVNQSLGQRMLNVGNLSVETAGGSSRITVMNIDRPGEVAQRILDAVHMKAKGPAE